MPIAYRRGAASRILVVAGLFAAMWVPAVGPPAMGAPPTADTPPPATPTDTTQLHREIDGIGDHPVTVPVGATSMTATMYGPADAAGTPGTTVTGTAVVDAAGAVRPGTTVTVRISAERTMLTSEFPLPIWLLAPGAGGTPYADPIVMAGAQPSPGGGIGAGHAVVAFTVPVATLEDLPSDVDFGESPVGRPVTRNIAVRAGGGVALGISDTSIEGPFAIDENGTTCAHGPDTNVPAGSACSIAIVFRPLERGTASGRFVLSANVAGGSRPIALTGLGTTKPAMPTSLSATAGQGQAVLSWMPPVDNGDTTITGYRVLRTDAADPHAAPVLFLIAPDTLTYTDGDLDNGTTYSYAVAAINVVGESEPSEPVQVAPAAPLSLPAAVLPPGTVGRSYAATLAAHGGVAPYHWLADDLLPPGVALDPDTGRITGTPTAAGETRFGVTVSDSAATPRQAKARYGVSVVAAVAPAPVRAALDPTEAKGDSGPSIAVWLWAVLGLAGLIGIAVAVGRLRSRNS